MIRYPGNFVQTTPIFEKKTKTTKSDNSKTIKDTSLKFWVFACLRLTNITSKFEKDWRHVVLAPG
jgi:hypothetical protein